MSDFIENRLSQIKLGSSLDDVILYHGSRGGIEGEISPSSRLRCDFGRGFYLGDNEMQAKGLVSDDSAPYYYKIKLHLSEIDPQRVLVLKDKDWLYTVLAHRKLSSDFNDLNVAKRTIAELKKYDVVIGPIADDRMNEAVTAFSDRAMTDVGLFHCLQYIDYGNQYVLKTQEACKLAEVLTEKKLLGHELEHTRQIAMQERARARNAVRDMVDRYQRQGMYLNEIINAEKNKEKDKDAR